MSECAVLGCKPEAGASIHHLPKDPVLKERWMDFIYKGRLSRPSNTVRIRVCGVHFNKDSFVNFFQRSMGFAKKLILKPDAVPCIYPGKPPEPEHELAGFCSKRANVACQCSPPVIRTRTVGTQLSERRLTYWRSVGLQTKLPNTGDCVGTLRSREDYAEQSKEGLLLTSQTPPPSPLIDWSEPEIEDDDQCVTVVTHILLQVSLSCRNQVLLPPQYCRNAEQINYAVSCCAD